MARTIATNTEVDLAGLLDFVRPRHRMVLMTVRRDGAPQSSPVTGGVDDAGRIVISTYPERAKTRTRYTQITWMWAGLFAARLAVQLPLYLVKNTEVLGVARLAMGPFLFAIIAWFSWMLVRGLPPVEESQKSSL